MLLLLQQQALPDFFPISSLGDKVEEEGKEKSEEMWSILVTDCWRCRQ